MVSVVIPNFNGEKIIKPCLDALCDSQIDELEIIVIDNASSDKSPEMIKAYAVVYVQNTENVGFAKAVNQGIKLAKHPYVFLLNSDVVVEKDTISLLLDEIRKDETVFSIQPKMMQFYNRNLIDDAGDVYLPFGWAFQLGHGLPDKYYNKKRITFSCCAGAALYRKSIFDEIGYFDESFFAYMEDVDIGFRANSAGYTNVYFPGTKVFHIGSASFGKTMTALRSELSGQNNVKVVFNNMGPGMMLFNSPFLLIGFFIKWLKFLSLGMGKHFFGGMKNGISVKRRDIRKGKFISKVQLMMLGDTSRFIVWRIRLIKCKLGG